MVLSIGSPSGRHASTCGYCSPPGQRSNIESFRSAAGLAASQLSNEVYQMMINRGWRRSGTWCYKPHLRSSCCPPYTIKLDATAFKPSKHQKKILNRWNKFVQLGGNGERSTNDVKQNQKGKDNTEFNLVSSVHASEYHDQSVQEQGQSFMHRYEMTLEESSYTDEKYALFKKYQKEIHHDSSSPNGFKRFLVDSPLHQEEIPYPSPPSSHLPTHYGSFHWCYRLDGKLIAISVIDILPECVSSVYFIYDKDYESFSLGKLSALREIALVQELSNAGAPSLQSLYLGYYIHSCQKMRYKAEYQPSYLCDPETYEWYPFSDCAKSLTERYACFSCPEHSIGGEPTSELETEFEEYKPPELEDSTLETILLVSNINGSRVSVIPANLSPKLDISFYKSELLCCVEELGVELASKIIFRL